MSELVPVVLGAQHTDCDSRVARMILWMLSHQRELLADNGKLTITWGNGGMKYSVERWYQDGRGSS